MTHAPSTSGPNPPLPPMVLSKSAHRTLSALFDVLVPPEPAVERKNERMLGLIAGVLPYLPPLTRRLLPIGLWLFELGTILFFFSPLPFSALRPSAREAYVRTWQHSRFSLRRQMVKGFKALALLAFYELPEARRHVGYDPEPFILGLVRERAELMRQRGEAVVFEPHAPPPVHAPDVRKVGGRP